MPSPLNVHGNVTTQDGTRYDDVQIVVSGRGVTVRQRLSPRAVVAERRGVERVEKSGPTNKVIRFDDGDVWTVVRTRRCGSCGG